MKQHVFTRTSLSLALAVGMGIAALPSQAATTYNGAIWDLTAALDSGTTYLVTYSVDFTGWNDATWQNDLLAINWKWSGSTPAATLASGPSGTIFNANAGNSGCTGGSGDFVCLLLDTPIATDADGVFEWVFSVDFGEAIDTAQTSNPLRAWFGPIDLKGHGRGLMSCRTGETNDKCGITTSEIPLPGTLGLLGLGMVALGAIRRRVFP